MASLKTGFGIFSKDFTTIVNFQTSFNKNTLGAAFGGAPQRERAKRPPLCFVVLNLFDDFVFLRTLEPWALERSDLSLGPGPWSEAT